MKNRMISALHSITIIFLCVSPLKCLSSTDDSSTNRRVRKILDQIKSPEAVGKGYAEKFRLLQNYYNTGIGTASSNDLLKYINAIEKASVKYPKFLNEADDTLNKKELCAYMSIVNWETDFMYFQELACQTSQYSENNNCNYIDKNTPWTPGKQYYGRGPKQLSWNYNYLAFSQDFFGDDRLLRTPELVYDNATVGWASSMYFWMSNGAGETNYGGFCGPQGYGTGQWKDQVECSNNPGLEKCVKAKGGGRYIQPGKMSPHDSIHTRDSMPLVINVVNGGYDCCPTNYYYERRGHTADRMSSYTGCLDLFGLVDKSQFIVDAFDECPVISSQNSKSCPDCTCLECKQTGNKYSFPWKCKKSSCDSSATSSPVTTPKVAPTQTSGEVAPDSTTQKIRTENGLCQNCFGSSSGVCQTPDTVCWELQENGQCPSGATRCEAPNLDSSSTTKKLLRSTASPKTSTVTENKVEKVTQSTEAPNSPITPTTNKATQEKPVDKATERPNNPIDPNGPLVAQSSGAPTPDVSFLIFSTFTALAYTVIQNI